MREILFKGFCQNDNGKQIITLDGKDVRGEWVEGFVLKLTETRWAITDYYPVNPHSGAFANKRFNTGDMIIKLYEIIPQTLCQFTGLTDKNGKRIWEWNILECVSYNEFIQELGHIMQNLRRKFTVEFYKGCFALREDYNDEMPPTYWKEFIDNAEYEVIGDIFNTKSYAEGKNEKNKD
jgi:uncharacterized phage protein (TIGR01671 family)